MNRIPSQFAPFLGRAAQWHLVALAALPLFFPSVLRADNFYVGTAQDLQNALTTAAANGADNVIYLTNGYYTGNFNYSSASGDNGSLTIAPEPGQAGNNVTLDGGALGRDLNITSAGSSGDVTVSNITFMRNCGNDQIGALRVAAASGGNITVSGSQFLSSTSSEGMGLEIAAGLNTTIQNCTVMGKNATTGNNYDGDGINISGVTGNTLIYSNTVSGNYVGYGADITASAVLTASNNVFQSNWNGALEFNPSGGSQIAQVLIAGNVISGNGYSSIIENFNTLSLMGNIFIGNSRGGAEVDGLTANVTGNTFSSNGESGSIGGLDITTYAAVFSGNTFNGNSSSSDGGGGGANISCGAYQSGGSPTTIVTGNTFSGNSSIGSLSGIGSGGAAYVSVYTGNLIMCGNTFSANHADLGTGGGVSLQMYNAAATVSGNTFTGNSSSGNTGGGGLYVNGGIPTISGNTFVRNSSADGGGAIYASGPTNIISDNLVANNSQSGASATGGGIFVNSSSKLYMINNTIFGNASGGGGGGVSFQTTGTQSLYVFNNIIWGNSATGSGQDVYLAGGGVQTELLYNDVNDIYGVWDIAQNLLNVDPQFFDPVNGDYHFPGTSPCADAGSNGAPSLPLTDLDGNSRTNRAGLVDLGCYEFNTTATHPADTNATFVITPGEFNAYAAAWKAGQAWTNAPDSTPNPNPITADYLTRAGYLMTNGGAYYNDGSARPVNWKPTH